MTKVAKHSVLIIDDENSLRGVLHEKFTKEGFVVYTATNGEEGLEVALRLHPDIILLDIIMPIMDGISMLKQLRADAWGKDAKVIMLTNLDENNKVFESMEKGVYDYLVKSNWSLEEVVKKVNSKL